MRSLGVRVVLVATLPLGILAAAIHFWLVPAVLALSDEHRRAAMMDSLVVIPPMIVVAAILAFVLASRTHDADRPDSPPAAIRAAHRLPVHVALCTSLVGLAGCGAGWVLLASHGAPASVAVPTILFSASEITLLGIATFVVVRRLTIPLLARVPASRVPDPGPRPPRIRRRFLLAIAIPVASGAIWAGMLTFRHADQAGFELDRSLDVELAALGGVDAPPPPVPVRPWALAIVLAGAIAVAVGLGHFAGDRTAKDLAETARSIDKLVERSHSSPSIHRPFLAGLRRLSGAVGNLARRYEEIETTETSSLSAREEAQRAKTQFLASMSHDLRSPLNSIIGFSELLLRDAQGSLTASQRENMEIIRRSGEELLRLINDILDSARIEAGRMDIVRRWTPSVSLVTDTIRRARSLVGDKPIDLRSELQPGLPPVHVDSDRIAQALFNLLSNAVKFMESGSVWVRARIAEGPPGPPGKYLRIEVEDSGHGIPPEHRETIFEAFRQLDAGPARRTSGVGLGLSLAKNLVALHGGTVWLESAVGRGSVFYVALPLAEEDAARLAHRRPSSP